jgi:hypothetical protein
MGLSHVSSGVSCCSTALDQTLVAELLPASSAIHRQLASSASGAFFPAYVTDVVILTESGLLVIDHDGSIKPKSLVATSGAAALACWQRAAA